MMHFRCELGLNCCDNHRKQSRYVFSFIRKHLPDCISFLADRTNGRAIGTVLRLSVVSL